MFLYACKLCYRSVGAKPVSGKTDPVYGINKRTLSFVEGKKWYVLLFSFCGENALDNTFWVYKLYTWVFANCKSL